MFERFQSSKVVITLVRQK